jgi:hypothetical protein
MLVRQIARVLKRDMTAFSTSRGTAVHCPDGQWILNCK